MFSISNQDLKAVLPALAKLCPKPGKGILPELGCVHISRVDDDKVCLRATDLNSTLSVVLRPTSPVAEGTEPVLLPAAVALKFIGLAAPDAVFTFTQDETALRISSSEDTVTVPSYDRDKFPALPEAKDLKHVAIVDFATLQKTLKVVKPYQGTDELREQMTGVSVDFTQKVATLVAIDGHRLIALTPFTGAQCYEQEAFWISPVAAELLRALKGIAPEATAALGRVKQENERVRNFLHIESNGHFWHASWPQADGRFPDWPTVLPELSGAKLHMFVDATATLKALAKATALGHDICALRFEPKESITFTSWAVGDVEEPKKGEAFKAPATYRASIGCTALCAEDPDANSVICLNVKLLTDVLKTEGTGPQAELYFYATTKSVLFGRDDGRILLMPVFVQDHMMQLI